MSKQLSRKQKKQEKKRIKAIKKSEYLNSLQDKAELKKKDVK